VTGHARAVLTENNNDPILATVALLQVLYDERDQRRIAEEQVRALAPKPGQLTLDGQEAEHYRVYKTFGTPEQIKARIERAAAADTAEQQLERDTRVDWAAGQVDPAGPWNTGLLKRLLRQDGQEIVRQKVRIRVEGQPDPQEVEAPYVRKVGDAQGQAVPLSEYAEQHWQGDGLLAALRTPPAENGHSPAPAVGAQPARTPTLTRFLPQGSAESRGSAPRPDPTGDYLRSKYAPPKPVDR
jgi:hypothetical protein